MSYRPSNMVRNNLLLGMSLAIVVLWWFLRKFRATLIVALSIPLCLFAAFVVLKPVLARTLNIISLAGLAFATGMVLDAAIVVLENIFRQREAGRSGDEASERGHPAGMGRTSCFDRHNGCHLSCRWYSLRMRRASCSVILRSAISAAVIASLIVAVTVLPSAASNWVRGQSAIEDVHHAIGGVG